MSKMPSLTNAHRQNLTRERVERENHLAGLYEAQEVFNDLIAEIDVFEKNLPENAEIGLKIANYGEAAQIHIRNIAFENPHLIKFSGIDPNNQEVTLIQHVSQLNFMLVATKPVEEEAFRIGFDLERDEEDNPQKEAD